jgi:uncharacterized phage protein (TIGR02218 family)
VKTIPTALQTHLDTGATTLAMCWKLARKDGVVLGFTEHDLDLVFDGVTFKADSGFTRSQLKQGLGLSVDDMDVAGALRSASITEDDIARGRYDAAEITVWFANWQDVSQRTIVFRGHIGEVRRGSLAFVAEVRSLMDRLDQGTGRSFQYFCDADLGDARCAKDVSGASFRATGTVGAAPLSQTFILSGVTGVTGFDAGWFNAGVVEITSGTNAGLKREIKAHTITGGLNTVETWEPFPDAPATGDTFTITAGCDKTFTQCQAKFANAVNFRGFPHMPGNDRVTAYPRAGERMDGSSLFN